jgi:hypothetical protein
MTEKDFLAYKPGVAHRLPKFVSTSGKNEVASGFSGAYKCEFHLRGNCVHAVSIGPVSEYSGSEAEILLQPYTIVRCTGRQEDRDTNGTLKGGTLQFDVISNAEDWAARYEAFGGAYFTSPFSANLGPDEADSWRVRADDIEHGIRDFFDLVHQILRQSPLIRVRGDGDSLDSVMVESVIAQFMNSEELMDTLLMGVYDEWIRIWRWSLADQQGWIPSAACTFYSESSYLLNRLLRNLNVALTKSYVIRPLLPWIEAIRLRAVEDPYCGNVTGDNHQFPVTLYRAISYDLDRVAVVKSFMAFTSCTTDYTFAINYLRDTYQVRIRTFLVIHLPPRCVGAMNHSGTSTRPEQAEIVLLPGSTIAKLEGPHEVYISGDLVKQYHVCISSTRIQDSATAAVT